MAGLSKVIVLDPDPRAGHQVQLGFEREGVRAVSHPVPPIASELQLGTDELGLVVIGGGEESLELVRIARELLDAKGLDIPILFAGRVSRRTDVEDAGADEVLARPAYLRDVVTIGRLLNGVPAEQRIHIIGNLGELTNVFTLVRALSALGRSATLTLMRGLRRGEVRFFHGEVTSAQVGLIHGQAALHQLLLWTDARFDFQHEDVVRRQQIPMSRDELFADAEHFLEGIKESSGPLSPSMVLEQDVVRVQSLGKEIPTEVHGVLRMFDGHRVLADVLEDSPYRVFETLRVAQRALEAGLLRVVQNQRPKATWRAVLSIEEWLVGSDRDGVVDRSAPELESGPVSGPASGPTGRDSKPKLPAKKRRNRKHRRANTPLPIAAPAAKTIDWGALVPRIIGADVGTLAGVIPAAQLSGEIQLPSRELEREKLEALMDTGKRDRIFPSDIGLEPSVVFDDTSGPVSASTGASAIAEPAMPRTVTGKVRDDAQVKVKELVKQQQAERSQLDALARRELEARSAGDSRGRKQLEAEIRARQEVEAAAAAAAVVARQAEVEAEAQGHALDEAAARQRAAVELQAETARQAAAAAVELQAETARQAAAAAVEAQAVEAARQAAAVAEATRLREAEVSAAAARATTMAAEAKALAEAISGKKTTAAREREEVDARVIADTKAAMAPSPSLSTEPAARSNYASDLVQALVAESTGEPTLAAQVANLQASASGPVASIPSIPVVDNIATAPTAPLARRAERAIEPPVIVENLDADRPKDTGGELQPHVARTTLEPLTLEPSILVSDLAAAAQSVASAATRAEANPEPAKAPSTPSTAERARAKTNPPIARAKTRSRPPSGSSNVSVEAKARTSSPNIATPEREQLVAEVRKDAVAFSDAEEAFFASAGDDKAARPAMIAAETFDDLDEGYRPVGFWDRVFGRKTDKPTKK